MKKVVITFAALLILCFFTGVASADVLAIGGGCVGTDNSTFGFTVHDTHGEFVYVDHDDHTNYKANTTFVTHMTNTTINFEGSLVNPAGWTYKAFMEETNKETKEQGNYSMEVYNETGELMYKSAGKRENGNVQIKKYIEIYFGVHEEKDIYIGQLTSITVHSFINIPSPDMEYTLLVDDYPIGKGKVGELKTFYYVPNASGKKKVTVLFAENLYDAGFVKVWIKRVEVLR
jgi:hypothetical protein